MNKQNKTAALIIPTTSPGSFGDAAMLSATIRILKNQHSRVDLLLSKKADLSDLSMQPDNTIAAERFFYKSDPIQKLYLSYIVKHYAQVVYIGADTIDGKYNPRSVRNRLYILNKAAKNGIKSTLLGSSYNTSPEVTTLRALINLDPNVTICARDPRSRERMIEKLNRPVKLTADLAFLLEPAYEVEEAKCAISWIEDRRSAGDRIIGLNANYIQFQKCSDLQKALTQLMQSLANNKISVVMIPHDTRPGNLDEELLNDAYQDTPSECHDKFYMLPPRSPAVVKAVISHTDMVVTGRMHAAIMGLGMGIPAFCFTYQNKFEGLMSFFDLENSGLLSTPEEFCDNPHETFTKIMAHLNMVTNYKITIQKNLPKVIELSYRNFD